MTRELGRLLTAMVTPFNGRGEVDYEQAKRLARALLDSGSDGVVVAGTTGESPTLTHEEKLRLFSAVKEAVGDRGTVIANTGNYSTAESIERTKEAERLGVDGVMAVAPYYNKPPQEGLYRHFRAIAEATSLPVIVYNVPSRTAVNISAETLIRLSEVPNIAGVKEASGDLSQVAKVLNGARPGFKVWSGNDDDTFAIMAMGGYGVISVASHLVGRQMKGMMEAVLRGDLETARREHLRLHALFKGLFVVSNPIPVKWALNFVGFRVGPPRLPLVEPDEKTARQIEEVVRQYTVDLPVEVGR